MEDKSNSNNNYGSKSSVRSLAAKILFKVIDEGRSLSAILPEKLDNIKIHQDRALLQALCFGVLRWYHKLDAILDLLLQKPLKEKDTDIYCLLLIGLYQLYYMRIPDHAAVNETVRAIPRLKKSWAGKFVNGVLRNAVRQQDQLLEKLQGDEEAEYSHPMWMIGKVQKSWPDYWQQILDANNSQAPLFLRVNQSKISRDEHFKRLQGAEIECEIMSPGCGLNNPYASSKRISNDDTVNELGGVDKELLKAVSPNVPGSMSGEVYKNCIKLKKSVPIKELPGYSDGLFSVQDASAQLAAEILNPQPGERVLDLCAAPGGKTCHILEMQPELSELIAVDIEESRLDKVSENLTRLNLRAKLICSDGLDTDNYWDGDFFDAILLDAPCSAMGVIRRHPDGKILKDSDDLKSLPALQFELLKTAWAMLKPGGRLLYATCSIFPAENSEVIKKFLLNHNDAIEAPIVLLDNANFDNLPLTLASMRSGAHGLQILPSIDGGDGFYYALLSKE